MPISRRALIAAFGLAAIDTVMSLAPHNIGNLGFISPAQGQPAALTQSQSDVLDRYNNA